MNRGCYNFPNDTEQEAWYDMIGLAIETMLKEEYDDRDLTQWDINPHLLEKCVTWHGWEYDFSERDRESVWTYFSHEDYPNKMLCIMADVTTFQLTISLYDKEEE